MKLNIRLRYKKKIFGLRKKQPPMSQRIAAMWVVK